MKFLIQKSEVTQAFSLVYREENYSFDIELHDGSGFTSIMINDLQLEIDDEGEIIYVWGLCPLIKHEETNEIPENYSSNCLVALLDKPPIPGVSYRLNDKERWPIYINKKKGWVCIGNPKKKGRELVEFVPNCVATLEDQKIIAIWLKPKNLPR